jgi:nucleoside-diphosphate-sugar epimerase
MSYANATNRLAHDLDDILARTEPLWQELRGERILITGATGFFGCWLLESFAWANTRLDLRARAVGLSRHPQALAQKAPHLTQNSAITLHAADVRCDEFPEGAFSHVIHAATEASAKLNSEDPQAMFDTILTGTRRTLEFARAHSCRKLLFLSSGAVYGNQPAHVTHLDESYLGGPDSLDCANAYAEGKRAGELQCALHASADFEVKIARCFAFVGPYMQLDAHFAIGNFISDAMRGGPIQIKGDGSPVRSYLYASDLMVWLWTILFKGQAKRAYNVGSEKALNIADVAREVAAVVPAVDVAIAAVPIAGADVHRYVPSTARARKELGLCAEVSLRDAIDRTYKWSSKQTSADSRTSTRRAAARGAHA